MGEVNEAGRTVRKARTAIASASRSALLCAVALVAALTVAVGTSRADIADLLLVSRATGPAGAKATADSIDPVISRNGRFVAFWSFAGNLSAADGDGVGDVYLRDLQAASTRLASRTNAVKGNAASTHPSVASGGRVAFDSLATNLDPDDADGLRDIFVRDPVNFTTTLVSRATGAAGDKAAKDSAEPVISSDGRFVAFSSKASNLDPDLASNELSDV